MLDCLAELRQRSVEIIALNDTLDYLAELRQRSTSHLFSPPTDEAEVPRELQPDSVQSSVRPSVSLDEFESSILQATTCKAPALYPNVKTIPAVQRKSQSPVNV